MPYNYRLITYHNQPQLLTCLPLHLPFLAQTREANRGHAAVTSSVTSSEAAAPVTAATSSEPLREEGQRELSHMDALLRQVCDGYTPRR